MLNAECSMIHHSAFSIQHSAFTPPVGVRQKEKGQPSWLPFRLIALSLRLRNRHIRSLKALGTLRHFELDGCALVQSAEALTLNRRKVHKHVFATFRRDEAEALGFIEPLNG